MHKAAFLAWEFLQHHQILVSSLPWDKVEMCLMTPAETLEGALSLAKEWQGKDARMLEMPHGNLTLGK